MVDSGVSEFPPLDDEALAAAPAPSGRGYASFLRSRPPAAEVEAVIRVMRLAGETGARVHVLHLSSADTVPLLNAAKASGTHITSETCPHYLTLAAEQVGAGRTEFKCCPPIREVANRERLWAGRSPSRST